MRLISLYILAMFVLSSTVQAREEFWYLGVGGGTTFLEDDDAFTSIDEKSDTLKAYVGYRASTYVAFELEYAYLGEYNYSQGPLEEKAEYSTVGLAIVVMYPLVWEDLDLYTPIGISGVAADYGVDDEIVSGYKLGFGVAYTPTKHFTMRVGGEVVFFDLDVIDETYRQQLSSVYATIQFNF